MSKAKTKKSTEQALAKERQADIMDTFNELEAECAPGRKLQGMKVVRLASHISLYAHIDDADTTNGFHLADLSPLVVGPFWLTTPSPLASGVVCRAEGEALRVARHARDMWIEFIRDQRLRVWDDCVKVQGARLEAGPEVTTTPRYDDAPLTAVALGFMEGTLVQCPVKFTPMDAWASDIPILSGTLPVVRRTLSRLWQSIVERQLHALTHTGYMRNGQDPQAQTPQHG